MSQLPDDIPPGPKIEDSTVRIGPSPLSLGVTLSMHVLLLTLLVGLTLEFLKEFLFLLKIQYFAVLPFMFLAVIACVFGTVFILRGTLVVAIRLFPRPWRLELNETGLIIPILPDIIIPWSRIRNVRVIPNGRLPFLSISTQNPEEYISKIDARERRHLSKSSHIAKLNMALPGLSEQGLARLYNNLLRFGQSQTRSGALKEIEKFQEGNTLTLARSFSTHSQLVKIKFPVPLGIVSLFVAFFLAQWTYDNVTFNCDDLASQTLHGEIERYELNPHSIGKFYLDELLIKLKGNDVVFGISERFDAFSEINGKSLRGKKATFLVEPEKYADAVDQLRNLGSSNANSSRVVRLSGVTIDGQVYLSTSEFCNTVHSLVFTPIIGFLITFNYGLMCLFVAFRRQKRSIYTNTNHG